MHTISYQHFFKHERLIESKKRLILKIFHNDHSSINKVVINVTYGFFFTILIHTIFKNKSNVYFLEIHPLIVINTPL